MFWGSTSYPAVGVYSTPQTSQLDLGIGGEMDEGEREGRRKEGMTSDQLLEEN